MSRLKQTYRDEIVPALMQEFGYDNVMQVPRLEKIVVNIGLGEATKEAHALEAAEKDLATITGQHPVVTRARKSISGFKVRKGMSVGMMVTLRGTRMYDFLDKLVNVTLPRLRDFQGTPGDSFDGRGNYTLGLREQIIFPEIEYDKVDRARGLEVSIVTTARTNEEGRKLLELLGMPFAKG
ncbi:MAG: 50S ribosomal protein L5 [Chloroflexota bacterium]|nr:50S ribosomal protein L5 [Chloroflexota bacterium]